MIDKEVVYYVYKELNMIGSNINQIARKANSEKFIEKKDS
ncbi:plasmid mobilization relaxosome protein MobC [Christensenella sp.]